MHLIGAHQSISGGLYKALLRGEETGCATVQIFLRSNLAWNPGRFTEEAAERFAQTQAQTGITPVVAHNCYLVNLAATDPDTLKRSIETTIDELRRAEVLAIPYLVMHPGAHLGAGERAGLRRLTRNLDRAIADSGAKRVRVLLETTAGQGTILGSRFEHLAEVIAASRFTERIGVCYDTCHTFAAGYDIRTPAAYRKTMRDFDHNLGIGKLLCFHVNDAVFDLGSRRDRHAHIGRGKLGESAFPQLLADSRLTSVPKILETPKGTSRGRSWDKINLETLRRLAGESQ